MFGGDGGRASRSAGCGFSASRASARPVSLPRSLRQRIDRGHRVLFGRNSEDLKVPYQPFIEVIRQTMAQHDGELHVPDGLAVLLPETATHPTVQRQPRDAGDSTVDSETQPIPAASRRLRNGSRTGPTEHPLTMIVDDVHWATDSTLQLLGHLQRRQSTRGGHLRAHRSRHGARQQSPCGGSPRRRSGSGPRHGRASGRALGSRSAAAWSVRDIDLDVDHAADGGKPAPAPSRRPRPTDRSTCRAPSTAGWPASTRRSRRRCGWCRYSGSSSSSRSQPPPIGVTSSNCSTTSNGRSRLDCSTTWASIGSGSHTPWSGLHSATN